MMASDKSLLIDGEYVKLEFTDINKMRILVRGKVVKTLTRNEMKWFYTRIGNYLMDDSFLSKD